MHVSDSTSIKAGNVELSSSTLRFESVHFLKIKMDFCFTVVIWLEEKIIFVECLHKKLRPKRKDEKIFDFIFYSKHKKKKKSFVKMKKINNLRLEEKFCL